jgi:glycosyltransferase involved in cell wall biosynthesis
MLLSVAICTYNRAGLLVRALESVVKQSLPDIALEVLVVDNGSTDETRDVVASLQAKNSALRYVVEQEPGIAHARNRAMAEARGEYLAFNRSIRDLNAWSDRCPLYGKGIDPIGFRSALNRFCVATRWVMCRASSMRMGTS